MKFFECLFGPTLKLVDDGKGSFAIRHRGGMYFDLKSPGFWWKTDCRFFRDCWSDEETARLWFARLCA